MALTILAFALGTMDNNTYLAADEASGQAAVIDPSFDPGPVLVEIQRRGWSLAQIWFTHAHFDHIAGAAAFLSAAAQSSAAASTPVVALHPADLDLYHQGGGARLFGFDIPSGPEPSVLLSEGSPVRLGESAVEVLHTPGHTPGHVVFYARAEGAVFCGDLIFFHSVGRTDLPGGSEARLAQSIRSKIFILPPSTRLLPGHGPETTVAEEIENNPFL